MDNDQQDAAPEFSVAQKVLAEHPLDPGFLELYEIRDELGSGGFGFVCSAWSRVENVEVAVKFIYKNKLHQRAVVKDWHRRESAPGILHRDRGGASGYRLIPMEAAILQFVQHPGIVNFKGLFEDSTFFYLIQELHGSPWAKHATPEQVQYATFMGPHSAGAHVQTFAQSPSAMSLSSSTASFYSEASEMDASPSTSSFSDTSDPSTPNDPYRRGSAPNIGLGSPPSRPPMMQRRSSHDLFECIEANERFDENKARYIFKQVVDTVAYLHRNGVCHRDIKDENIVIDDKLQVKLIDFGSAVCYDARFEPPYYDRFFGTLNFASSEILQGYPYQAAPAEVWSLGVLLSILLTGVPPFETQRDAVYGRIRLKHTITRDALSLMQRCLHPNPHSRYTIEQVKRHRWFAREGASRLPLSLFGNNQRAEQAAELAADLRTDVVNGARPMLYKGGSS
ncbi:hypothetical protein FFLO_02026 [Filobasidium floriforme]|uniref:Protein kinase domain-containing protein n=1 Tax=Filobasidium floriforme TaxID=5210 RepID=A0A8K0JP58_9TREE|nr:hypothetical protein FFLO_02026 [Filobasidium floriforme]